MPKAELHVHIEGTLEPELVFELAARNKVALPVRRRGGPAPRLRLRGPPVVPGHLLRQLRRTADRAGLLRPDMGLPHQGGQSGRASRRRSSSTLRRTPSAASPSRPAAAGSAAPWTTGAAQLGISSGLILCFLRDLSEEAALADAGGSQAVRPPPGAVGLDSAEVGNPPSKFVRAFRQARSMGLPGVAHAGEEGPSGVHLGGARLAGGAAHRSRRALPRRRPARRRGWCQSRSR